MRDPSLPSGGTGAQELDPWLEDKGFRADPFEHRNAEQEEDLSSYYVDLAELDPLRRHTDPCVVLAARGVGKTALRQILAAQYRPLDSESGWLAVHYTYTGFDHVLRAVQYDLEGIHAPHHVEAILRQGLSALHAEAKRDAAVDQALGKPGVVERWIAFVSRFAPQLPIVSQDSDGHALNTLTCPELLAAFAALVRAAGLHGSAILVDGVDEFMLTAGSPERAARFIAPLLSTLSLLENQQGLVFKLFLPQYIEPVLTEQGWLRPDRARLFRIAWTRSQIEEMLAKRMRHFGPQAKGRRYRDIAQLCDDTLRDTVGGEIYRLAAGSPRSALTLASELLHAHCKLPEPPNLVSKHTWDQVKGEWIAKHGAPQEVRFAVLSVKEDLGAAYLDARELTELTPRLYTALACLYRHQGQTVSKNALIDDLYEGIATDDALTQLIRRLRSILKKHEPEATYIVTAHGTGYRLYPQGRAPKGQDQK